MTRHRRPDDGKYLLKDQQAWWRLVRRARACARNPGRQALDLAAAASAAARAVIPPGHVSRESVFIKLLLKARVFDSTHPTLRDPLARQLEVLASECAELLGMNPSLAPAPASARPDPSGSPDPTAPEAPDPADAWRRRADLD